MRLLEIQNVRGSYSIGSDDVRRVAAAQESAGHAAHAIAMRLDQAAVHFAKRAATLALDAVPELGGDQ